MKKILLIVILIILAVAIFIIYRKNTYNRTDTIAYVLNGKTYSLLVADTTEERMKGLMNVRAKKGFDGMLFTFPDKSIQNFWNENTFVDLDIYWLDDDRVIGQSLLPSIEKSKETVTVSSPGRVNKVVELIR